MEGHNDTHTYAHTYTEIMLSTAKKAFHSNSTLLSSLYEKEHNPGITSILTLVDLHIADVPNKLTVQCNSSNNFSFTVESTM